MSRTAVLAVVFFLALGADQAYEKFLAPKAVPRPLRIPFSKFPADLLGSSWREKDEPLRGETARIASVTDYIQRSYRNGQRTLWLYVGYVQGWDPSGIHHPGVCFPLSGLDLESRETVTIPAPEIPRDLRFSETCWRRGLGGRLFTLTTFYYRGKFEPSEVALRADRFLGIDYFAVITVSGEWMGSLEETRRVYYDLIRKAAPELLRHFPE